MTPAAGSARRRVELVHATVELLPGGAQRASVQLWRRDPGSTAGEKFVGNAEDADALRAAAEATLDALRRAQPDATRIDKLVRVETLAALGATVIGVSLAAYHGGQLRELMGFCRVERNDPLPATGRAVLDATNRFLGDR